MTSFGQRFKKLRQEKNLTQEKLAEKFFLNKSSISRYEQNKQLPEIDLLEKIADFFDVSVDYLLGRVEINSTQSTEFAHRLKQLRKDSKLTQEELSNKLSSSRSTIAGYETERKEPDYETLKKIADFFDVSVDYLLGRTDIKKIEQNSSDKEKDNSNPFLKEFEGLSPESQKELEKYMELLKIKEQMEKSKDETSSALENEA